MKLVGNTILITGGTRGIGFELASQLLALGNVVLVTGRTDAGLKEVETRLPRVHAYRCDVTSAKDIDDLFDLVTTQYPNLNGLINNAGQMRRLDLLDSSISQNDVVKEVEVNLAGPIRMTQRFLIHLAKKEHPFIANVTSGLAFVPFPLSPIYGATKAALHSYTQSLRVQLTRTSIRVFEVAAPAVKTSLNDKFEADLAGTPLMEPTKLVNLVLQGMEKDRWEIRPGFATVLRFLSRFAPGIPFAQMSNIADRGLARPQPIHH